MTTRDNVPAVEPCMAERLAALAADPKVAAALKVCSDEVERAMA